MSTEDLKSRTGSPDAGTAKRYEPTSQERGAIQRVLERRKHDPPAPKMAVKHTNSTISMEADHPDPAVASSVLFDTFCTADIAFVRGLGDQLANVARMGKDLTSAELNFMLSTVRGIGPRDQTEVLLAVQMAAIHNATMVAARRLNRTETIQQQDSASNMLNKLARTFAAQLEALKRYRSTGEQSIRVQHVNVNAGQAVVGVNQGGGVPYENRSQSHAPSPTDECSPTLLRHEQAIGMPMQGTSGEGAERVPHARGKSRRAEGQG